MHWIYPLYKLSTCWAQQVERIWTPCWEVLSGVASNLKLVKLFAQHGSTFPLFRGHSCVAQQSRVHLHSNAQLVEPTDAQCPAYPKIAMVYSHHFLVACSVLDHFTMLLLHPLLLLRRIHALVLPRRFFSFLSSSMSSLTRSAASHFRVLRGWIYLRFSAIFNMSFCEIFGMLNMSSHCWGNLNTPFDNTSTCWTCLNMLRACTVHKSNAFARGLWRMTNQAREFP